MWEEKRQLLTVQVTADKLPFVPFAPLKEMSFIEVGKLPPQLRQGYLLVLDRNERVNLRSLSSGETQTSATGQFAEVDAISLGQFSVVVACRQSLYIASKEQLSSPKFQLNINSQVISTAASFALSSCSAAGAGSAGPIVEVFVLGCSDGSLCVIAIGPDDQVYEATYEAHPGALCSKVWIDAASSTVCSLGSDASLKTWTYTVKEGELSISPQNTLTGHIGSVTCVAFVGGFSIMVTGGVDQSIKFWNLRTGNCVFQLEKPGLGCAHERSVSDVTVTSTVQLMDCLRVTLVSTDILGHQLAWVVDIPLDMVQLEGSKQSSTDVENEYADLLCSIMGDTGGQNAAGVSSLEQLSTIQADLILEHKINLGIKPTAVTFIRNCQGEVWGPSLCLLLHLSNGQHFAATLAVADLSSQQAWWSKKLSESISHSNWKRQSALVINYATFRPLLCMQSHLADIVWAMWRKSFVMSVCRNGRLLVRETRSGMVHTVLELQKQVFRAFETEGHDGMWILVCHSDATLSVVDPEFNCRNYKLLGIGGCIWAHKIQNHLLALQADGCFTCVDTLSGACAAVQVSDRQRFTHAATVQADGDHLAEITILCSGNELEVSLWKLVTDSDANTLQVHLLAELKPKAADVRLSEIEAMLQTKSTVTALLAFQKHDSIYMQVGTWNGGVLAAVCPHSVLIQRSGKSSGRVALKPTPGKYVFNADVADNIIEGDWCPPFEGQAIVSLFHARGVLCASDGDSIQCLGARQVWEPCQLTASSGETVSFAVHIRDEIFLCGWSKGKLELLFLPEGLSTDPVVSDQLVEVDLSRTDSEQRRTSAAAHPLQSAKRRQSTRTVLASSFGTERDASQQRNRSMRVSVAHMTAVSLPTSAPTSRSQSLARVGSLSSQPAKGSGPHVRPSSKASIFEMKNPLALAAMSVPTDDSPAQNVSSLPEPRKRTPSSPPAVSSTLKERIKSQSISEEHVESGAMSAIQEGERCEAEPPATKQRQKPTLSPSSAAHLHAAKRPTVAQSTTHTDTQLSHKQAEAPASVSMEGSSARPLSAVQPETVAPHAVSSEPERQDTTNNQSAAQATKSRRPSRTFSKKPSAAKLQPSPTSDKHGSKAEVGGGATTKSAGGQNAVHPLDTLLAAAGEAVDSPQSSAGAGDDDVKSMLRLGAKPTMSRRK